MPATAALQAAGYLLAEQACLGEEIKVVWIHLVALEAKKAVETELICNLMMFWLVTGSFLQCSTVK